MKLEQWGVVGIPSHPFEAPELWTQRLTGNTVGDTRRKDGTAVTTAPIEGKRNGKVVTMSGSEWELGEVAEEYERLYPDARNRLMGSLPDV